MGRYILQRLALVVPVLIGVTLFAFLLIHLIPGDPARIILGERASLEQLEQIRERLGLNDPLHIQYLHFMQRIGHGDLGRSAMSNNPVTAELKMRYPATIELALAAMFIAISIGIPAGIISASKQYSLFDHISMILALLGVSMPIFWLGLMLIWGFALALPIFPPSGRLGVEIELATLTNFHILDSLLTGNWIALKDALWHLVLPGLALGTIPMAIIARMTRSSMLEVLRQDYIRTAKAKGVSGRIVVYKHALRNALIPVLTVIGLQFGLLLGGAVLTETIFSWPGIGRLIYDAIMKRDFPIVQGTILTIATTFVFMNLLVDITYAYLDPRIKYN